ncbi:MAG TPA: M48 family peptidase, partial [Lacunisphaera sp.]|nr:M48 family peptidase [Lacunisphaera sp.]
MDWLLPTVVAFILLRLAAQLALEALNRTEVRRHADARPEALAGVMDDATYAKSVDYTLAKSRFSSFETMWEVTVLGAVLFSGLLPWLWTKFNGLAPGAAWSG